MGTKTHVFSLEISLAGCCYDVRINDVAIFRDMEDGYPMTASMAVNEYLVDRANTIAITLRPRPESNSLDKPADTFTVRLLCRLAGSPKTANAPLVTFHIRPGQASDQFVRVAGSGEGLLNLAGVRSSGDGQTAIDVTGEFTLAGESFHWSWQDGNLIENSVRNRDALRAIFADWTTRLTARDASWLHQQFRERNQELAQALFEPIAAVEAHGLLEAVADSGLTLFDPDLGNTELRVLGAGRLAQLVRWDGTPVIVFLEADQQSARYYPLTFRMGTNGWVVCR